MRYLLCAILAVLLCVSQSFGFMLISQRPVAGGGACASGTYTNGVDWITTTTNAGGTGIIRGNSFQIGSTQSVYSFVFELTSLATDGTILCRLDDDTDMTSEYMDTATVSAVGAGVKEAVFDTHVSLSSSTTYYVLCQAGTAVNPFFEKAVEDYTSGQRLDGTGWVASGTSGDIKFGVKVCN